MSAKELIRERLKSAVAPLAVHEFHLLGVSENALASRLGELARAGEVIGTYRPGTAYKQWSLVKSGINSILMPLNEPECPVFATLSQNTGIATQEAKFEGDLGLML